MAYRTAKLFKPRIYLVDREANSVGHMRTWSKQRYHFLICAKNVPSVQYGDKFQQLYKVAEQLRLYDLRSQ